MEMQAAEQSQCEAYLRGFDELIGDKRTANPFRVVIEGIIGGESLRASQIARFSPGFSDIEVRR